MQLLQELRVDAARGKLEVSQPPVAMRPIDVTRFMSMSPELEAPLVLVSKAREELLQVVREELHAR